MCFIRGGVEHAALNLSFFRHQSLVLLMVQLKTQETPAGLISVRRGGKPTLFILKKSS